MSIISTKKSFGKLIGLTIANMAIGAVAFSATYAMAQNIPSNAKITLYSGQNLTGQNYTSRTNIPDLNRVSFNDRARSLELTGKWEVCLMANYQGMCRKYEDARISNLDSFNGLISSVRYIGPTGVQPPISTMPMPIENGVKGSASTFYPGTFTKYRNTAINANLFCREQGLKSALYRYPSGKYLQDVVCK